MSLSRIPSADGYQPVSTFNSHGCSQQRDQENYGIIYSGDFRPASLPGETGMVYPPLRVEVVPPLGEEWWPRTKDMRKRPAPPIPPPNMIFPSKDLPCQSRVDYRRLCEVEHSIRCRNIGLVDGESLGFLQGFAARLGLRHGDGDNVEDVDVMDLS